MATFMPFLSELGGMLPEAPSTAVVSAIFSATTGAVSGDRGAELRANGAGVSCGVEDEILNTRATGLTRVYGCHIQRLPKLVISAFLCAYGRLPCSRHHPC